MERWFNVYTKKKAFQHGHNEDRCWTYSHCMNASENKSFRDINIECDYSPTDNDISGVDKKANLKFI